MALENRIESLKKQHARLDQRLHAEENRPGVDDIVLHHLKAEKLALKDKIHALLHDHRVAA